VLLAKHIEKFWPPRDLLENRSWSW
jgi:hypothetical protein